MSQIVTRKGGVGDEKEKRQTDSPVKDMKKKIAATAEKEKQAAEKSSEKIEKPKQTPEKPKPAEKPTEKPKPVEKSAEKPKQADKPAEKPKTAEKPVEKPKSAEKPVEKPKPSEKPAEKSKPTEKSQEKPVVVIEKFTDKNSVDNKKTEKKDAQDKKDEKVEKNGKEQKKSDKAKQNGSKQNGVDSNGVDEASEDDPMEGDEEFPELAYDETSDTEPAAEASRSLTRRDQVKATRTPETPQPAGSDESKLKVKDDAPPTDRKLRSSDSPRPEKKQDKEQKSKEESEKNRDDDVIEIEIEVGGETRKPDTNFSKSRVKVSPYRRSDNTNSSLCANYTGNNSTMEMDITESFSESTMDDSYLAGLSKIRARRSYKALGQLSLSHSAARNRLAASLSGAGSEQSIRPTGTVVGRKRKPDAAGASEPSNSADSDGAVKRVRLLDRIAMPFRRENIDQIVGVNTDLPMSAPLAACPPAPPAALEHNKRCVIM